jgi:hypothetical protein
MMIAKEYRVPVALLILGAALWITSLYQLEIIYIWITLGKDQFEFPFYIWITSLAVARDFWYLVNGISLALSIIGGAVFNSTRMELMRKRGEVQHKG